MASLAIPEPGILLGREYPSKMAPNVFGLTLNDSVVEEMIKCVQNKKQIQLFLGDTPKISYGVKIQHLSKSQDPFTHKLYESSSSTRTNSTTESTDMMLSKRADPTKGVVKVENKPNHAFLAVFAPKKLEAIKKKAASTAAPTAASASKSTNTSETAGADAALAALQKSLASEQARKQENSTQMLKDGVGLNPNQRKGGATKAMNKSNAFSQSNARSIPSSPAMSGVGSPALGRTSVPLSQQQAEQAKTARKPIIHLLAASPLTEIALREKIDVPKEDIKQALGKISDLNSSTGKWELRKNYYKELGVWSYEYDKPEDRQRAIDNAIKQYDRMRLGSLEPEWDRLLPKSERGTGKCLSKHQAAIAQGKIQGAPKINVQKPGSGSNTPASELEENTTKPKINGENMTRSTSQAAATKARKANEKDAQTKKLLPKNPTKTAVKPSQAKKDQPKKDQPKKDKPNSKYGKILSAEFVSESDDEDEVDSQLLKPEEIPKVKGKVSVISKRAREEDIESSDSAAPLSKKVKKNITTQAPKIGQVNKAKTNQSLKPTNKRPREEEVESSDPGTPLSKKAKKTALPPRPDTTHTSSNSSKNKGSSPHKSSPLASSPPTNASEIEIPSAGDRTSLSTSPDPSSKSTQSPNHKRHQKSSSVASSVSSTSGRQLKPEIVHLAAKYKMYYPRYEALYRELQGLGRKDEDKQRDLMDMHDRLGEMKKRIMAEVQST